MKFRSAKFILLAAGHSERMGVDKGLLNFHGLPWIVKQAKEIQVHCKELIVVANKNNIEIYKKLLKNPNIKILLNPKNKSEIFDSLEIGLKSENFPNGTLMSPIDVPITHTLIKTLLEMKSEESLAAIPVYHQKKGHPVYLSSALIERIVTEEFKERRLDSILHAIDKNVLKIQTNEINAALNLNSIEDWEKLQ